MDAPPITTVWVVRFTKIFFYLCALMMLLVGLAGALEVDVTIKPKFMPYYWHYFAEVGLLPSLEVGVAVSPQVTVLGKITGYYYDDSFYLQDEEEENGEGDAEKKLIRYSELAIAPGIGPRYTFLGKENIDLYGYGVVSLPILKEIEKGEQNNIKAFLCDLGVGSAYKLKNDLSLIVELGLQGYKAQYNDEEYAAQISPISSMGVRLAF